MEPRRGKINRQPDRPIAQRSAPRELQFHQCKSLQDDRVSLSAMGRAQDRFGDSLNVAGMDGLGKRSYRGIKRDFHHRDHLGRKGRIGKILHDGRTQKERLPTRLGSGNAIGSRPKFDMSIPRTHIA